MGNNQYGKLGIKNKHLPFANTPQLVDSLATYHITQVSCGWNHTAVVTKDGSCYTWGQGDFGQLGLGQQSQHEWHLPSLVLYFSQNQIRI